MGWSKGALSCFLDYVCFFLVQAKMTNPSALGQNTNRVLTRALVTLPALQTTCNAVCYSSQTINITAVWTNTIFLVQTLCLVSFLTVGCSQMGPSDVWGKSCTTQKEKKSKALLACVGQLGSPSWSPGGIQFPFALNRVTQKSLERLARPVLVSRFTIVT